MSDYTKLRELIESAESVADDAIKGIETVCSIAEYAPLLLAENERYKKALEKIKASGCCVWCECKACMAHEALNAVKDNPDE